MFSTEQSEILRIQRERHITFNTMCNYTRFPLGVLNWSGWAQKQNIKGIYERSTLFYALTDEGRKTANWLSKAFDLRQSDISKLPPEVQEGVVRICTYKMLERAGFDIAPVEPIIKDSFTVCTKFSHELAAKLDNCIFSPFQELAPSSIKHLFPAITSNSGDSGASTRLLNAVHKFNHDKIAQRSTLTIELSSSHNNSTAITDKDEAIAANLKKHYEACSANSEAAVNTFIKGYEQSNQVVFYPLVAQLFRLAGFKCEHSRAGVNYQRFDAFIFDNDQSIPIEIKSPSEEMCLSVKAVRQSLENKIILLARKAAPTKFETTSLAVGFDLPADRAEVCSLMIDILKAYGIKITVIDFRTLAYIALAKIVQKKQLTHNELASSYGILEVKYS